MRKTSHGASYTESHLGFLFAAYSITWLVLFGYLFVVWRKQNRLEKGMQQLQEKIQAKS